MRAINRSRSLREDAYQSIKASILSNELKPGQQLKEEWLATQLEISSTPVREALAKLEQEGLVKIIPHRGKFVTEITPESVRDIYEVRRALEVLAVELATPSISQEDLEDLEAFFQRVETEIEQGNYDNYFESDSRFHQLIVQNARNQWLTRMVGTLNDHVKQIRAFSMTRPGPHKSQSFREHRAILEALKARDAAKAKELMKLHIQEAGERIAELVVEERPQVEGEFDPNKQNNSGGHRSE